MIFNNIIGNDAVKNDLKKAIEHNLISHSYIFQGTEGIGKILFAKDFAKSILCENKTGEDNCKSCIMFDSNNHPDFILLNENEEAIKIDEIREFIKKVIEKPIISKNKVCIINAADKMTKDAQNCLLKTLEEPPEYMTIILISSNENLLLTTIKSRCTKIQFNRLSNEEIREYIKKDTNINLDEFNFNTIKYLNGSIKKINDILNNKDTYLSIERFLKGTKEKSKLEFYLEGKIIYDKDKIYDFLEFMISVLYDLGLKDSDFLNGIQIVQNTINKLKSNNNFDMSIDNMLFKIWEGVNENNNWRKI